MGHTFTNHLYHIVFSTKDRRRCIISSTKERLLEYIGGIVRRSKGTILAIDATDDHIHLLVRIQPDISVSKFVGIMKANSSKWASETFPELRLFQWQAGYSSFSVSESNWQKVARYIARQPEHHRKLSFAKELAKLLDKHHVEFDKVVHGLTPVATRCRVARLQRRASKCTRAGQSPVAMTRCAAYREASVVALTIHRDGQV